MDLNLAFMIFQLALKKRKKSTAAHSRFKGTQLERGTLRTTDKE